ncbi:MAG: GNAT family N-acetyltransferase [Bacteroidota bacterium]
MQDLIYQDETISMQDFINKKINEVIPSEAGLTMEIYRNDLVFEILRTHWVDLAERSNVTIYLSYEWAKSWWDHYGKHKNRNLFVITLWSGPKLVALAPMYEERSRMGSKVIEHRMRFIGSGGSQNATLGFKDDYGISDFLDVLVDPDYTQQVAKQMARLLNSDYVEADRIFFDQARDDSFVINSLYPTLKQEGLETSLLQTDTCPYIVVDEFDSLKSYIQSLDSSSARRRFRQTLRAADSDEYFVFEEPQSWDEIEEATEAIISLHQDRWNELGFPGVFYEQRFEDFFKQLVQDAYERDWLWFKVARDDQGICAARMLIRYNNRYFDYISGFDDNRKSAKRRPGIGLLINVVRDAIEEGTPRVELLRGEESYKYDFTNHSFNNWQVQVELNKSVSWWQKSQQSILHASALVYRYAKSESRLMNVQRKQHGWLRMLPGYFAFRKESIKIKMNED